MPDGAQEQGEVILWELLKNRILVQIQGGREFNPGGIQSVF